ncbi:hypothetical protein PDESU_01441 [Pontiella desulfatans]|uniref:Nucleotidyl transferase AbiEii/AbiGii toxin family protein n=1 Tax=Pontiella desulfatans TaxID=2750659 RepID=A0A6C2TZ46_PONDE|nr:nucleotidyl transferase AbiEii/AbiGii toxin family protein [Pontiella desulfatans]VGO12887.1 hypothetical protein PDESU_01441 [Pontiella desulfatans]
MIPRAYITHWKQHAPWISDAQVEQDLVISRALVDIFSDELLADSLAFRGGTALHKLYFAPAPRYSEDIDLVQIRPEPIGAVIDRLREVLNYLEPPKVKQKDRNALNPDFRTTGLSGTCGLSMIQKDAWKWEENEEHSRTSLRPRWRLMPSRA